MPVTNSTRALQAQAEAGVRHRAVAAQVEVPPVAFRIEALLLHPLFQHVEPLLALAAADDLADAGHQHVHGPHRLAVVVDAHVEGLDGPRVVVEDHRLLEVSSRSDSARARLAGPCPSRRGTRTSRPTSSGCRSPRCRAGGRTRCSTMRFAAGSMAVGSMRSWKNCHVLGAVLEHVAEDALEERLGQVHVVVQVVEGHLRLDHPELGQVAGGVGVLGAEGRAEGVDLAQGAGEDLGLELAADRQVRGLAEEVLGEVDGRRRSSGARGGFSRSRVVTLNISPAPARPTVTK